jgi:3-methylcrotonyl-CoA carboxylase alpha subunit
MRSGVFTVRLEESDHRVTVTPDGHARVGADASPLALAVDGPSTYRVDDGRRARQVHVVATGDVRLVFVDGEVYDLRVGPEGGGARRPIRSGHDALTAPMPAKVTAVIAEPGQSVRKGAVLLTLEAMKMELAIRAPRDGTVRRIACRVGELVQPGVVLMELD